jgi:hypothetical protein
LILLLLLLLLVVVVTAVVVLLIVVAWRLSLCACVSPMIGDGRAFRFSGAFRCVRPRRLRVRMVVV